MLQNMLSNFKSEIICPQETNLKNSNIQAMYLFQKFFKNRENPKIE